MWSSPWGAATPAPSSPANATKTGNSTTPPALDSTPYGSSATTSNPASTISSLSSPDTRPVTCPAHLPDMDLSLFTDNPGQSWSGVFRHFYHRTLPVQFAGVLDIGP